MVDVLLASKKKGKRGPDMVVVLLGYFIKHDSCSDKYLVITLKCAKKCQGL